MNKTFNVCLQVLLFFLSTSIAQAQGTFDAIPNTDGQQSQLFDVYADSNFIYVIGDLKDTTIASPGQTIIPWWGVFDYSGNLLHKSIISVDSLTNRIGVFGSRILKGADGNFLYDAILYNDKDWAECFILKIEPSTGEVLNHKVIGNPIDTNSYIIPTWISLDPFQIGNLFITSYISNSGAKPVLFNLDSELNILDTILIEDNGRDNYIFYSEKESDSTFIFVGDSRKRNDQSAAPDAKPFFMRVNLEGVILKFNLAKGIPDKTVGFFLGENKSVSRDINGNWIFSALSFFPGWHSFPYVFSYDYEFENMNWAINFSADKTSNEQQHNLFGGDYNSLNHNYMVVGSDNYRNDSYIFKTNDVGDSLWTRHYIPLNWNTDEVGLASLIGIAATPYLSFVSVGKAVKRPELLWKSWAILIDSFGCIVPGCEIPVGLEESDNKDSNLFTVYPNPATSYVALLCNLDGMSQVRFTVFDMGGRVVESVNLTPAVGYQYLLNVSGWSKGMYIIRVDTANGQIIQESKIVVN